MAMTFKKKVSLIAGATCLFVVLSLLGTALYLFYHPDRIKPFLERTLSALSDSTCTIENLSYSLRPAKIQAKKILFTSLMPQKSFSVAIHSAQTDLTLEGPFGKKSLILKNIKINGLNIDSVSSLSTMTQFNWSKKEKPTAISHLYRRLLGYFLFKTVRFESGEIAGGRISFKIGMQTVQVDNLRAKTGAGSPLLLNFSLQINRPSSKAEFIAPVVNILTEPVFNLLDHHLIGTLQARNMTFENQNLGTGRIHVVSKFAYIYPEKKIIFDNLKVHGETIALSSDMTSAWGFPLGVIRAKTIQIDAANATFDNNTGDIEFPRLNIAVSDMQFKEKPKTSLSTHDIKFKANGRLNLYEKRVNLMPFHLVFSDIIDMAGHFQSNPSQQDSIRLKVSDASILSEKAIVYLPPKIKRSLETFRVEGPVSVRGDFWGKKENDKWAWDCDFISHLKNNPYAFFNKNAQLSGTVSAGIKVKGRFPDVIISADIKGDANVLSTRTLNLEPFKAGLQLSMRYPFIDIKDAEFLIPRTSIKLTSRNILLADIRINIPKGRIDGKKRSIAVSESRFEASGLKNIYFSCHLKNNKSSFSLNGRETGFLDLAAANQLYPASWALKASDTIGIQAGIDDKGMWNLQSTLSFKDLSFQNKDGSKIGDNISLDLTLDGILDSGVSRLMFKASVNAREGETLFDRYYLNLQKNPFMTSGSGSYDIQKKHLQLTGLSVELTDILPLEIQGNFYPDPSAGSNDLTVRMPPVALKPIFQHLLREPFKTEKPFLEALEPEGTVTAKFNINWFDNSWQIKGRFGWQEGRLNSNEKNISLEGIHLDLPVWYRSSSSNAPSETLKGRIDVQSLTAPLLPEQAVSIDIDVDPNQISVKSPIGLRTLGGDIQIGPVQFVKPYNSGHSIQTSLSFAGIELRPFLSDFTPLAFSGSLSGKLDPIQYQGNSLTCQGKAVANIFGGRVVFSGIGASQLLTSVPVFKLDAVWEDLLLAEMTTDTPFGKIEGVLNGYMRDVEIAFGQPQKFNLFLETIRKKNIPQKISVKAIDNISRVGSGQSPFMGLTGAFASFFKSFPYEKIGIRAGLENDVFVVNGTIKEDGVEYLVKRGRFSGVNVVNQNPDNRTSFKDMVNRIKRITQKRGPIVK